MTGWKLEDISEQAREAAKTAARMEKMTLGAWLSRALLSAAKTRQRDPETESGPDQD